MPVFDFFHWTQPTGGLLALDGPIIPVEISMPTVLEEWCVKQNIAVPAPISGYALIDTGASISGIHQAILDQLSLLPIDSIPMQTPAGQGRAFVYPTKVSFPSIQVSDYPMSRVVGSQLGWTTSQNHRVIMLLGRDLLIHFLMVYNGKFNAVTLAYQPIPVISTLEHHYQGP